MTAPEAAAVEANAPLELEVEARQTIEGISPKEWDALGNDGFLASTWKWHRAFEADRTNGERRYFVVRKKGEIQGAATGETTIIPYGIYLRPGALARKIMLSPMGLPATMARGFSIGPFSSFHRPGLYLRSGADPVRVGAALREAMRAQGYGAISALWIPVDGDPDLRVLARETVSGDAFPFMTAARFPPGVKAEAHLATLSKRRRKHIRQTLATAESLGYSVTLEPNLRVLASEMALLLESTRRHYDERDELTPLPRYTTEPRYYRYLADKLGDAAQCVVVRDRSGNIVAGATALFGSKYVAFDQWGMTYPAPENLSLYNLHVAAAYPLIAARGLGLDLGPMKAEAKRMAGAVPERRMARVWFKNPLVRSLRLIVWPGARPWLDDEEWDEQFKLPPSMVQVQRLADSNFVARLRERFLGRTDPFGEP